MSSESRNFEPPMWCSVSLLIQYILNLFIWNSLWSTITNCSNNWKRHLSKSAKTMCYFIVSPRRLQVPASVYQICNEPNQLTMLSSAFSMRSEYQSLPWNLSVMLIGTALNPKVSIFELFPNYLNPDHTQIAKDASLLNTEPSQKQTSEDLKVK